jgi:hypothetical protein
LAPTLRDAVTVAGWKVFVIVDGTLLRIDRVGWNVRVIADPESLVRLAVSRHRRLA